MPVSLRVVLASGRWRLDGALDAKLYPQTLLAANLLRFKFRAVLDTFPYYALCGRSAFGHSKAHPFSSPTVSYTITLTT
jgi:hypothetical protein